VPTNGQKLLKPDAPQQILKARVIAQIIPFRFDFQKNHFRVSLFKPTLQQGNRFVALAPGLTSAAPAALIGCFRSLQLRSSTITLFSIF